MNCSDKESRRRSGEGRAQVSPTYGPCRLKRFVAAIVVQCIMSLVLLLNSQAGAMPRHADLSLARGYRTVAALPYSRFLVRGTHGFKLIISGTPISVRLIAVRRGEAVQYIDAAGHANSSEIKASFGSLGRVFVRFHPSDRYTSRSLSGELGKCRLIGRPTERVGTFIGHIEFHGENDFTKVRLRHAIGRAGPRRLLKCPNSTDQHVESPDRMKRSRVSAVWSDGTFYAGADAFSELKLHDSLLKASLMWPRGPGVPFSAEESELRGLLLIDRIVIAKGGKNSFIVDQGGQTARIEPPRPFEGMAMLNDCPAPEWRGQLSVVFPGRTVKIAQHSRHAAILYPTPAHGCTG